jgi:hypothetical protein
MPELIIDASRTSANLGLAKELSDLIHRAYSKGDPKDLDELEKKLKHMPELYKAVFDVEELNRLRLVDSFSDSEASALGLMANARYIADELKYNDSPMLERLLIDNLINCFFRMQYCDLHLSGNQEMGASHSVLEFWEKRLSVAQQRYLRAIEVLARVRNLVRSNPALQVNMAFDGGQQINAAVNVKKND